MALAQTQRRLTAAYQTTYSQEGFDKLRAALEAKFPSNEISKLVQDPQHYLSLV